MLLGHLKGDNFAYLKDDISGQLRNLFSTDFIELTGINWLREYPRYLDAMKARLEKVPNPGAKDRSNTELIALYWARYLNCQQGSSAAIEKDLQQLRWMIEEFRVSLFAQGLKTRMPVSGKRLDKQLVKLKQL